MTHSILLALGIAASLGLGTLAFQSTTGGATGGAPVNRPDCPGQITCPQTGEVICRDRCPLDNQVQTQVVPPCCRGGE